MTLTARISATLLLLACTAASLGQDTAPPPRPAPSPPAGAPGDEAAETPPPAAERPEADDDEFIPTEELNPDAAVTFPVDI